jgi:L-alanine-DL-glutamate epimerase-like enolase superfamily enzyme
MDHPLVQVKTDAGVTGWGEGIGHSVIPATKAALETYVGPGASARRFNRLSRRASLRKLRSTLDSYSTTVNQLSSFQPRP